MDIKVVRIKSRFDWVRIVSLTLLEVYLLSRGRFSELQVLSRAPEAYNSHECGVLSSRITTVGLQER